jgi:hypothetical protein
MLSAGDLTLDRRAVGARLDGLTAADALGQPISALCNSYVHLHCNRLLGTGSPIEALALQLLRRTREGLSRAPAE